VVIEYKVRVGMGADRGDGVNTAQASMRDYNLQSMVARAKVVVSGGVFTREACIVGKVYADCNNNGLQDEKEPGIANVKLYLENGTTITTDENGQYSMCGVRAITHVLKIDSATLPAGSVLGITSNRNVGDPNTLFVDVLAGQLHNTEFRIENCTPGIMKSIDERQKGSVRVTPVPTTPADGVQFDSSKPNSSGLAMPVPVVPSQGGTK
jgi:SdrD B-like domain